jgi:hypothetical protein
MVPIFHAHMASDRAQAELAMARGMAAEARACLLCFERDPATCHRRIVAGLVCEETGQAVVDLIPE